LIIGWFGGLVDLVELVWLLDFVCCFVLFCFVLFIDVCVLVG